MGFLSKKKDADGDDGNRKALFGSRKSEKASSQASNPCMSQPSQPSQRTAEQRTV